MQHKVKLISVFVGFFLHGCAESELPKKSMNTFSVSDYEYTMNNQQAVSISFGETESNFCSITIYRASVAEGLKLSSSQNSNNKISAECNWSGKYYVQSSKHQTATEFEILTIDQSSKNAQIRISANLVEPKSEEYFEFTNTTLTISGVNFENLMKAM